MSSTSSAPAPARAPKPFYTQFGFQVLVALVIGLILLFAVNEFPDAVQDVVDPTVVGWILVIAGVLALVLILAAVAAFVVWRRRRTLRRHGAG